MKLKGLPGGQYQPLSKKQVNTIHEASLTILEDTGVAYESGLEQTIEMLEQAGATIDQKRSRVIFPKNLVTEQNNKSSRKSYSIQPGREKRSRPERASCLSWNRRSCSKDSRS